MKLRTLTYLGVAGLAAVLVYQMRQDARIEDAARDLRQVAEVVMTGGTMPGDLPAVLRGSARVVDGRTIQFLNPRFTVELAGIDVCDAAQWAYFDETPWPCGAVSTAWLVSQAAAGEMPCISDQSQGMVQFKKYRCYLKPPDGRHLMAAEEKERRKLK